MNLEFDFFPQAASSVAHRVDVLYLFLVAVAAFFTVLICVLILTFGIKYRRGSKASRANAPQSILLEISWALVPLVLSMVMFVWGAVVFFDIKTPPADTLDIDVLGKQWMWKIQHPGGQSEINQLHIPTGRAVRLRMISQDVIHSFYVPAFRVKQDVLPGYYSSLWFEATKPGVYHLFCAEYCGTEHSKMIGSVVVMEPDEYANWLAGDTGDPPEVVGQQLFERFRCASCHKPDGSGSGPSLVGLYGSTVPLKSGGTVVADDQYIRDSILNPAKQIVAGRQPVMPSYQGQLDEAQVLKLISYIRSLGDEPGPEGASGSQSGDGVEEDHHGATEEGD